MAWIIKVYSHRGYFLHDLQRPCWRGEKGTRNLTWKVIVHRSFRRALLDAVLRTNEARYNPRGQLIYHVAAWRSDRPRS